MRIDGWTTKIALPGAILDAAKHTPIDSHLQLVDFRGTPSGLYQTWLPAEKYPNRSSAALTARAAQSLCPLRARL